MIFDKEHRIVDDRLFAFKKKLEIIKLVLFIYLTILRRLKKEMQFFYQDLKMISHQSIFLIHKKFLKVKDLFKHLNENKKLKYVVLRDQVSDKDDIDILVNNYYLFKRISDCHSYKLKNLNFISNSGDPIDDNGFKVSNYIKIKNKIIKVDVRFTGDGYFDSNWQKTILRDRVFQNSYYFPNKNDLFFSILYHIVYHKGYIDKKYTKFLKQKLKLDNLNINIITKIINKFLSEKI